MIITITGNPGSGKSTVAKMLAKKLKYKRFYGGGFRREIAKKKGMNLAEFNAWSETHKSGDTLVDNLIKRMCKQKNAKLIIEGRTAWHFIPDSLKIYIYIDPVVGAKRIWQNYTKEGKKRNEDKIGSWPEMLASVKQRARRDVLRYKKHYGVDINRRANYDLWLDATKMTKKQEFNAVYRFIQQNLDSQKKLR